MNESPLIQRNAGFGLGLRTQHYEDFLREPQPVDWLEILSDNYLVDGGKPLLLLDRIRANYPMVMHGVAMSIGAAQGVDDAYLRQVKALADRVQPLWISDHLCWIGPGPEQLHDLYPLPFTDEAAKLVIAQIRRVQDVLQRRFVLENVSSYIDYKQSACSEWQFLSFVAQEADCLLLLDVNNVYVSSVNHGFDARQYLAGLPGNRIQQIHLAGHSDHGDHIIDTHDHPVAVPVWDLYREACRLFGQVPTMIERDDNIPDLQELIAEVQMARTIARDVPLEITSTHAPVFVGAPLGAKTAPFANVESRPRPLLQSLLGTTDDASRLGQIGPLSPLRSTQQQLANHVLARPDDAIADQLRTADGVDVSRRLGIYSNAYRARLAEVLADTYAKTLLYMGSDAFDQHARDFAVAHPPLERSLNRYGKAFVDHLKCCYPASPELWQLAQLDWDLRACFDGADVLVLDAATVAADSDGIWLTRERMLHPGLVLREITMNIVPIWRAIDDDVEVPEAVLLHAPLTLAVWRKDLQPHFKTVDPHEATFLHALAAGGSITNVAARLEGSPQLPDPSALGLWLREWWEDGFLIAADGEAVSIE